MLKQLDVYSPNISVAPYSLDVDGTIENDLFQITNIDGLDPVAADINTSKLGVLDGETFGGSSVGKRNIVMTVKPNPDWVNWSYESLRRLLTAQFAPKSKVRLVFTSSELLQPVQISGYVETLTQNIFSQDPEYQISIICTYPYFVDLMPQTITGETGFATTDGVFANSVFPELQKVDINYIGTAPTGFMVKIPRHNISSQTAPVVIFNKHSSQLDAWSCFGVLLGTDNGFVMSTLPGDKYARATYDPGVPDTSILSRVSSASTWPELKPGLNQFQVSFGTFHWTWELTYFNRWAGL